MRRMEEEKNSREKEVRIRAQSHAFYTQACATEKQLAKKKVYCKNGGLSEGEKQMFVIIFRPLRESRWKECSEYLSLMSTCLCHFL